MQMALAATVARAPKRRVRRGVIGVADGRGKAGCPRRGARSSGVAARCSFGSGGADSAETRTGVHLFPSLLPVTALGLS
jgi:hypothetical protein